MFGRVQRFRSDLSRPQRWYAALCGNLSPSAETFRVQLDRCLTGLSPSKVLDAGCGKGTFSFYLAQRFPSAQVVGVDLCPDLHALGSNIDVCREMQERSGILNTRFEKLDLHELDAAGEYDLVVSIHVLEHIPDNEDVIRRLARALAPGGHLHIQMPRNGEHASGHHLCEELAAWSHDEHVGREYEPEELSAVLESFGLETVVCKTDGGWLQGWAWRIGESLRFRRRLVRLAIVLPFLKLMIWIGGRSIDDGTGNTVVLARKPRSLSRGEPEADGSGVAASASGFDRSARVSQPR